VYSWVRRTLRTRILTKRLSDIMPLNNIASHKHNTAARRKCNYELTKVSKTYRGLFRGLELLYFPIILLGRMSLRSRLGCVGLGATSRLLLRTQLLLPQDKLVQSRTPNRLLTIVGGPVGQIVGATVDCGCYATLGARSQFRSTAPRQLLPIASEVLHTTASE